MTERGAWFARRQVVMALAAALGIGASGSIRGQDATGSFPSDPMVFGMFEAQFKTDGTFKIDGKDWEPLQGRWKKDGAQVELSPAETSGGCDASGRYAFHLEGTRLRFEVVADPCASRRMVLDQSTWRPAEEAKSVAERRIVRTARGRLSPLPAAGSPSESWPSFRGPIASGVANGQNLPDTWSAKTGEHILWRIHIPGLGHSSPVAWGDRIFITTAISSDPNATFRPGLYGDGDSSADRSRHRFVTYAVDRRSGKVLWERVAYEGEPVDKRHVKSTYASATPATDGRVVVSWFGSQGVYAYDMSGSPRWKIDLGHLDLGAYNIPTLEWGPASSPIIWNGLVILQCDTHEDSFIMALNADTGEIVWKTERDELPSWGTPTVGITSSGPELVTNASRFIRGYDPRNGRELWRLGRSSFITAPTPVFDRDLFVVASGRAPERPIFAVRAEAHGDITLPDNETRSDAIAWSLTGRGSYMPTPLVYNGILYVLANNGILDAYNVSTGKELYRQRLPEIGSGFSASPIAADGRIYLSSEDGEISVVQAGPTFKQIAANSMGELLMATPALSHGVMYVRSVHSLFAIGR
jgi:outer membrane protein assembly factor BamB